MLSIRGHLENLRQEKVMALVFLLCAITLACFVVYPLGVLIRKSLLNPKTGGWTLFNYTQFFLDGGIYDAFLNTVEAALGTLILGIGIGVPMAWGVSRTNMPLKGFIRSMVVLTFATPTFLTALAWVILLGPKAGTINETIKSVFSLRTAPFNIFSMAGLIFVLGIFLYPFIFFSASTALDNIDPSMEEASVVLGASKARTLFGITLPLIAPAIFSGGILVILQSFALFGAPAVIGMPAKLYTISTKIYSLFYFPPRFEMAAAVATPMILMTAILLIIQKIYLGKKQYITMGGVRTSPQVIDIGMWRYVLTGFSLLIILLSIFLPFFALLSVSVKKIFGHPFSLENLSLQHYRFVFLKSPIVFTSLRNSFLVGDQCNPPLHDVGHDHRLGGRKDEITGKKRSHVYHVNQHELPRNRPGAGARFYLLLLSPQPLRDALDSSGGLCDHRPPYRLSLHPDFLETVGNGTG